MARFFLGLKTILPRRWSLRATFIAIMAGSAMMVFAAAAILIWSIRVANDNLEQAATAQLRLEQLLQLSGRISDYGIVAFQTVGLVSARPEKLDPSIAEVERAFDTFDTHISTQVNAVKSDDGQAAFATKGLNVARMRALFRALNRQIVNMMKTPSATEEETAVRAQNIMNVFGVQFTPLLAQALEDERKEIRSARMGMAQLRGRIVSISGSLILFAILTSVLLYRFAGRPILRRISETMRGAEELAAGNLERRLKPRGGDELTLLMIQFNRMADVLERREKALLAAQDALQATIAERTRDLRESNERLEFIDSQRRQFFSDVSHELRTPLTVILGESDLALKGAERLDPEMRASWIAVKARGESLRRRVDDLLRVARSESGELDLRFFEVDINEVAVGAIEEMGSLAEKFAIELVLDADDKPLLVRGDADWLRQAMSGIITNAIRYGDAGKPVLIETRMEGETVTLAVADQGVGIPENERPHIFKRFYRGEKSDARTAKRGDRGFGIGLSLVKWVVEEHGGTVGIETNDGLSPTPHAPSNRGSVVKITLPAISAPPILPLGRREVAP